MTSLCNLRGLSSLGLSAALVLCLSFLSGSFADAAEAPAGPVEVQPKVRYRAGKDLSFEELLIEGQLKRPDLNVITGETEKNGNGLLRLRENFLDRMTAELGEEAQ